MSRYQSTSSLLPFDHVADPPLPRRAAKQKVLLHFIATNWLLSVLFLGGSVCCAAVFAYTWWLGGRPLGPCPTWAIDCHIDAHVEFFQNHSSRIQGIVTTIYGIGLAMMLTLACALAEAGLWPILHQTQHDLSHIDTGNQSFGGGIGLVFKQVYPGPSQIPGAAVDGAALYSSWSNGLAVEPLPAYRNYIISRAKLNEVGNFSAAAIKADLTITCTPRTLNLTTPKNSKTELVQVATNYPKNDSWVLVPIQPMLATWVDGVVLPSSTRSVVTVVFACFNGTIEGGTITQPTTDMGKALKGSTWSGVSAVACDVDVDFRDDTFDTDPNSTVADPVKLSTLDSIDPPDGTGPISGLAIWLGAATSVMGVRVVGAQPMFSKGKHRLPTAWTSTTEGGSDVWKVDELKNFIVSAGAIAMSMPGKWPPRNPPNEPQKYNSSIVALPSQTLCLQLERKRTYLLLGPVGCIIAAILVLIVFNKVVYRDTRVSSMRLMTTGELIKSGQTTDMRAAMEVDTDRQERGLQSKLGDLKVRYGIGCNGMIGLWNADSISKF